MTRYMQVRFLLFLFAIVSAIMLYGAVGEHGPEYYSLLRVVTCFAAVLVAILGAKWGQIWATVVFSFVAILLNPFIQIGLSQSMWRPIDVGIAMLFLLAIYMVRAPGTSEGKWQVLTLGVPLVMALVFVYGLGWLYIYGPYKAKETLTNRLMECIEDVPVEFRGDVEAAIRSSRMTAGYNYKASAWSVTGPGLMPTPAPPRDPALTGREILEEMLKRSRLPGERIDIESPQLASLIIDDPHRGGRYSVSDDPWLPAFLSRSWLAEPLSLHWVVKGDYNGGKLLSVMQCG